MLDYFLKGGPLMYPLALCSVVALAVIIMKFVDFHRASKTNNNQLINQVKELVQKDMVETAITICRNSTGPVAAVLTNGLKEIKNGKKAVEETFHRTSLEEVPRLESYTTVLSIIATISTLIGFTGTVTGMIRAFNSIAAAGITSPSIVASGVAEALITTAAGLIIAVPVWVFYYYFNNRIERFIVEMEKAAQQLLVIIKE